MNEKTKIEKWIFENHFHIEKDDFYPECTPSILYQKNDMSVVNSIELEELIKDEREKMNEDLKGCILNAEDFDELIKNLHLVFKIK